MPSNRLTNQQCLTAKPRAKAYKLFDGEGMFLNVSPTGAKSWRLQYRLAGKQQTMTLGLYPTVGLAEARRKRQEARDRLAAGDIPDAPRKAASGLSLKAAVDTYWDDRQDITDGYRTNAKRALEMHILPDLGARPVASITRDDLMVQLNRMNAAGLFVYVRKTRRWLSQVLDWCVEQGHAKMNHALAIRPERAFGRRLPEHHAAVPLAGVADLMKRLALEPRILSVMGCELLAYTWARTGELRAMRWTEIEGDLWRIPKERMKRRREHLVPLSRQALAVLEELRQRRPPDCDFVFPNDRRFDRPMSENSVLYLLGRIGYGGVMTGHGWRSIGSTWANEHGWNPDAVERQLAHAPEGVRGVYNAAEHLPVRRQMLQAFADWLDQQRSPQRAASTASIPVSAGSS